MEHSRKKSCKHCRQAKSKCSLDLPQCLRCMRKNLSCDYEPQVRQRSAVSVSQSSEGGMFHSWLASTEVHQEQPSRLHAPLNFTPTSPDIYVAHMDWSENPASLPITTDIPSNPVETQPDSIFESTEKEGSICWFEIPSVGGSIGIDDPFPASNQRRSVPITADNQHYDPISALSLALKKRSPTAKWEIFQKIPESLPNLLSRKHESKISSMIAGNAIWAIIQECTTSFAEGKPTLFLHSQVDLENNEALANCVSIVGMYRQKTKACTPLVLKTLLAEIQRLYDEFRNYDEKNLLYALQALTVYMVTLAMDDERCKILSTITRITMGEMATQALVDGYLSPNEKNNNFPKWEEFIHAESNRRTSIILHLLDVILDMDIRRPQSNPSNCSHLDVIPLPCSKALWEAPTAEKWEKEYKSYLSNRKGNKMLTIGDVQRRKSFDADALEEGLSEDFATWATGIDGFGMMLLTSLLLGK